MKNAAPSVTKRTTVILSVLLAISVLLNILFCGGYLNSDSGNTIIPEDPVPGQLHHEGYELVQTVVLSRHNIRAPMSGKNSTLSEFIPHEWIAWSSNPSELSLRGGTLETEMGQYFRKWLESEGLIAQNWIPEDGQVRFYANAKQRTIATANYFLNGMLPVADVQVETQAQYDTMDPVFNPILVFTSEAYEKDVNKQVWDLYGEDIRNLESNFALISDICDIKESQAYTSGEFTGFDPEDMQLEFKANEEPAVTGSLRTGCTISDALILQYYEAADPLDASFGHPITEKQWKEVSMIKDVTMNILYGTPLLSYQIAHPLLTVIRDELHTDERKFTFLCGHDSNLISVLSALGVEDYALPDSIERNAPIGGKIVFSRWKSPEGKEWISVDMVYRTPSQLRGLDLLDNENHPAVYRLSFEGLEPNEDGLYPADGFTERLDVSIEQFDILKEEYGA